ncbi:hypothetical protein [Tellurirhabdus rosea]|uniref:hypothetical protein n=1 Tax=Tellurirhabdus rosea TaxID=2674997 RepID=UPI0022555D0B|nr:hypothetical protein [Tellurirhabdus rosea]
MDHLDKETFSFWVTHPDELLATDFQMLQQAVEEHPYCQALYILGAKAASVHQRSQAMEWIRQAAAHALSRNALRKLIDNEFNWSENLLTRLNELSLNHVSIPDDYQKESYALFRERAEQSRTFPSVSFLDFRKAAEEVYGQEPEPQGADLLPIVDDTTVTENALQSELEQTPTPAEPAVPEPNPVRQQQLDIIEQFIRNEPQITRVRLKPGEQAPQEDLAARRVAPTGGGLVTESFAKILIKQGKFDKAIDIYQKLMVKNPEKKSYFADQIRELESRQGS